MPGLQAFTAVFGPQNTILQLARITEVPQAELTEFASEPSLASGSVDTSAEVYDPLIVMPTFCPNSCANPLLGISSSTRSK